LSILNRPQAFVGSVFAEPRQVRKEAAVGNYSVRQATWGLFMHKQEHYL